MKSHRIGIDLGGTKTEIIALDEAGQPLFRARVATPPADSADRYSAILDTLTRLYQDACSELALSDHRRVRLGIGIPGMVDQSTGLVQNANTTCLNGRPLAGDLEQHLGRRLLLENDANCFALAECRSGAGRDYGLVFGVIMGTGCGGGLCINGEVRSGPHAIAGEWGHMSIDPDGPECYCGKRGCIETLISGGGVERHFRERTGLALSMTEIHAGARKGDRDCVNVFESFLDSFGQALGGLISILDPDAIVLGGGLSGIPELYDAGAKRAHAAAFHPACFTPVLQNQLGDSAGVFGAAWRGVS